MQFDLTRCSIRDRASGNARTVGTCITMIYLYSLKGVSVGNERFQRVWRVARPSFPFWGVVYTSSNFLKNGW